MGTWWVVKLKFSPLISSTQAVNTSVSSLSLSLVSLSLATTEACWIIGCMSMASELRKVVISLYSTLVRQHLRTASNFRPSSTGKTLIKRSECGGGHQDVQVWNTFPALQAEGPRLVQPGGGTALWGTWQQSPKSKGKSSGRWSQALCICVRCEYQRV